MRSDSVASDQSSSIQEDTPPCGSTLGQGSEYQLGSSRKQRHPDLATVGPHRSLAFHQCKLLQLGKHCKRYYPHQRLCFLEGIILAPEMHLHMRGLPDILCTRSCLVRYTIQRYMGPGCDR